jgi:hypothetical protein
MAELIAYIVFVVGCVAGLGYAWGVMGRRRTDAEALRNRLYGYKWR